MQKNKNRFSMFELLLIIAIIAIIVAIAVPSLLSARQEEFKKYFGVLPPDPSDGNEKVLMQPLIEKRLAELEDESRNHDRAIAESRARIQDLIHSNSPALTAQEVESRRSKLKELEEQLNQALNADDGLVRAKESAKSYGFSIDIPPKKQSFLTAPDKNPVPLFF